MRALVPLSVIASDICSGMGDGGNTYKFAILRHLLSVYKEFHLFVDHDFCIKTVELESNHTIELPCDFIYETKIGLRKNGITAVLRLDRNMPQVPKNESETLEYLESIWEGNFVGGFNYPFYNCHGREIYGYGCNLNRSGFYNIDRKTGTLQIGSLLPDDAEIIIEYKSNGLEDGLQLVPSEVVDVLSYGAKERFYEERGNWNAAKWNGEKHKEKWYMTKRLYNFTSALYTAEVAYNNTSQI